MKNAGRIDNGSNVAAPKLPDYSANVAKCIRLRTGGAGMGARIEKTLVRGCVPRLQTSS